MPPLGPSAHISSPSLRKALALIRFVDLQKSFCDAGSDDESDLSGRLARLDRYKEGRRALLDEMTALGEKSILQGGTNFSFLQTLEQIIDLETRETEALKQEERSQAAARRGASSASASASAPASAASSSSPDRKRKRGGGPSAAAASSSKSSPPKELICPILHTLMMDPVSTADGHTFERSAIARWLQDRNTSPLTGLPLANKTLTPNHGLRSLAAAFASC